MVVNVHKAKTDLSKLIALAEAGEEVVIARNGSAVVKLVVVNPTKRFPEGKRPLGRLGKKFPLPPDFEQRWTRHKAELARMFDESLNEPWPGDETSA